MKGGGREDVRGVWGEGREGGKAGWGRAEERRRSARSGGDTVPL